MANDYIPEYTLITMDMVKEEFRNTDDLMKQKEFLTSSLENVVGKRAVAPIFKEEPVNIHRIVDNSLYMDEQDSMTRTLFTISIDSHDKALSIKPGNYIDIWLKPTENGIIEGVKAEKLFDKLKVYDTRSENYTKTDGTVDGSGNLENVGTYITLYLTDDEIAKFFDTRDSLATKRVTLHGEHLDYLIVKEKMIRQIETEEESNPDEAIITFDNETDEVEEEN